MKVATLDGSGDLSLSQEVQGQGLVGNTMVRAPRSGRSCPSLRFPFGVLISIGPPRDFLKFHLLLSLLGGQPGLLLGVGANTSGAVGTSS